MFDAARASSPAPTPPADPAPPRDARRPTPGPTRNAYFGPAEVVVEGDALVLKAGRRPTLPAPPLVGRQLRLRAAGRERARRLARGGQLPHGRRRRRGADRRHLERARPRHLHRAAAAAAVRRRARRSASPRTPRRACCPTFVAVDEEGRASRRCRPPRRASGSRATSASAKARSCMQAFICVVGHPGLAADAVELLQHRLLVGLRPPSRPGVREQQVDDAEVAVGRGAAGDHRRPEARLVEIDLAEDQPHLAGVDVVRLDLAGRRPC